MVYPFYDIQALWASAPAEVEEVVNEDVYDA